MDAAAGNCVEKVAAVTAAEGMHLGHLVKKSSKDKHIGDTSFFKRMQLKSINTDIEHENSFSISKRKSKLDSTRKY